MKILFTLILCTLSTNLLATNELSLADIAGTYSITSDVQPGVENQVDITEQGIITLYENSMGGTQVCSGKVEIANSKVSSVMNCGEGMEFRQSIDLSGVDISAPVFMAPVTSDLYILFEITEPVLNTFTRI